jgi:hypothetical protein
MGLLTGNTIVQGDFINQASKNATPTNDANKVPKMEADGRLSDFFTRQGAIMTAGATINGATLPVPIYQNKTDNEVYACDGNDTAAMKFIGFAVSNGTNGNPINVRFNGVVGGFSGLDEGEKYYLSDTAGTISSTPGTYEVLVGVAISTTEIMIQKGPRFAMGTTTFADAGVDGTVSTHAVVCGFRPSRIRVKVIKNGATATSGSISMLFGTWHNGSYISLSVSADSDTTPGTTGANGTSWLYNASTSPTVDNWTITITSVTDTGFTISAQQTDASPEGIALTWEAEGIL